MLKIITNKSDYQFSHEVATDTISYDLPITLFGKHWYMCEIVVHPDGHISGSWYRNRKVICSAE